MAKIDFNMDNQWLPFTPNRSFKESPRVIVAADGMHFTTHDGRKVIDDVSITIKAGEKLFRSPVVIY